MELFVRALSDSAPPVDLVPIYLVHSVDAPFCPLPGCWCHANQEEIAKLLEHIREGVMTLREAAAFADGRTV